jgi:putative exosortase-associated protein (TIGR04073 family)
MTKRTGITLTVALAMLTLAGPQPAWAARTRIHEAAESERYGRKFGGMIGRGALNVLTSPVDVITNVVSETKSGPPFVGTMRGVGQGLGCGLLRLGSGAIDIVTFWVPGFNGFPVSDQYGNCLGSEAPVADESLSTGYSQPAQTWDVPTTEPGAAQVPVEQPKKYWKK